MAALTWTSRTSRSRSRQIKNHFFNGGALAQNTFTGKYDDPSHPGCTRTISYIGGRSYQIDGADEDKKPWKVIATKKSSSTIVFDFTPKGGPSGVAAVQQIKSGNLKFPDGNEWKKVA